MQLTEKALRCMELGADKTLSFGCIISDGNFGYYTFVRIKLSCNKRDVAHCCVMENDNAIYIEKNIGHPLSRGRLCYLLYSMVGRTEKDERLHLNTYFLLNPELYNQTILERQNDDELMDLVLEFLEKVK